MNEILNELPDSSYYPPFEKYINDNKNQVMNEAYLKIRYSGTKEVGLLILSNAKLF